MTSAQERGVPAPRWTRSRAARVTLPAVLLVAFLTEFFTREGPDYALHAWVGVALIPIIAVHLAGNVEWITAVWKRRRQHRDFGLALLNVFLAALVATCIVTGFPLWLGWSDAAGWTGTHTVTGIASIIVMLVHLWRNRARLTRLLRPRAPAVGRTRGRRPAHDPVGPTGSRD